MPLQMYNFTINNTTFGSNRDASQCIGKVINRILHNESNQPQYLTQKKRRVKHNMQDFRVHKELKRNTELSPGLPPTLRRLTKSMSHSLGR
uniref:Uncharacterized protein n=1 Tax=Solanum tuberosum TaxID=4113 RepID=M1BT65_SOLTU